MGAKQVRLGRNFERLWAANAVSNLGDGAMAAAGPLLIASLTSDPALVGGATFVQQLPWLLFSLPAGVLVDRWDRRRVVVVVNVLRFTAITALAAAVMAGAASVVLVYAVLFAMGLMETLADNASSALLPSIVAKDHLPRANARLMSTYIVGGQLAGPPLGALLFVFAAAAPFGFDAATFLVAAVLIATLRISARPEPVAARRAIRHDIATGVRALMRHPVLRLFALCLCFMNITLTGAFSILVLYARERLGLDEVGFGVLLTAMAIGGIAGTAASTRLLARFGMAALVRIGLLIETATHLALALVTAPWAAMVTLAVFGAHGSVLGVTISAWKQRVVPDELRGRINSVYMLFATGGSAIGAAGGGLVARWLGITAPFWIAFGGMVVFTALAWRSFSARRLNDPDPAMIAVV